ncbi:hypothetical protein PG993_009022 [Apiospora rasikravindrae]|uniref:DUF7918 domain-containing protein n=1 Tax=Apiospora rasikravindrae TaxID=990691 RepID=A0ABR1SIL8_9PEZI
MAVLRDLPSLEARIVVGGGERALREFAVPDTCKVGVETDILMETTEDSFTVTLDARKIPRIVSYVVATAGNQFGFRFFKELAFNLDCHHLAIEAQCDGMRTPLRHLLDTDPFSNDWAITHDHVMGGPSDSNDPISEYAFTFGELEICQLLGPCIFNPPPYSIGFVTNISTAEPGNIPPEDLEQQRLQTKNHGTLRLFVYKMNKSATKTVSKAAKLNLSETQEPLPREVFEPRALTHRVFLEKRFRESRRVQVRQYFDEFQDDMRRPCAIFEFRYRSKSEEIRRLTLLGLEYEKQGKRKKEKGKDDADAG